MTVLSSTSTFYAHDHRLRASPGSIVPVRWAVLLRCYARCRGVYHDVMSPYLTVRYSVALRAGTGSDTTSDTHLGMCAQNICGFCRENAKPKAKAQGVGEKTVRHTDSQICQTDGRSTDGQADRQSDIDTDSTDDSTVQRQYRRTVLSYSRIDLVDSYVLFYLCWHNGSVCLERSSSYGHLHLMEAIFILWASSSYGAIFILYGAPRGVVAWSVWPVASDRARVEPLTTRPASRRRRR